MLLSSLAIIITKQLTSSVTWPFDSSPAVYCKWSIGTIRIYLPPLRLKRNGVTALTFWRHRSRDYSTRGRRLMGGPWRPCVYLAPLWRYGASNVVRTDGRTLRWFCTLPNAMHCIGQTKTLCFSTAC